MPVYSFTHTQTHTYTEVSVSLLENKRVTAINMKTLSAASSECPGSTKSETQLPGLSKPYWGEYEPQGLFHHIIQMQMTE